MIANLRGLADATPRYSWPEHLQQRISQETGVFPQIDNTGVSGDSTANMLSDLRLLDLGAYDAAIIYGGANDTNAPREIQNIENGTRLTLSEADENGFGNNRCEQGSHVIISNTVTGESFKRQLTGIGGQPTIRLFLSEPLPPVDNLSDYAVAIDTATNLSHMSRILRANGVNWIVIVGAHLRAFDVDSGGEDVDCRSQKVDELPIQASTRQAQKQAAQDSGAIFVNTLDQNLGLVCNENPNPSEIVEDSELLHRLRRMNDLEIRDSHLTVEGRRLFLADPIFSVMRQEGWF